MKKTVLFFTFLFAVCAGSAQSADPACIDGQVYVKFRPSALKHIDRTNPRELRMDQFPALTGIFARYGVTRVHIPFYQASEDGVLPYILKFHFTAINNAGDLIAELNRMNDIEYAERVPLNRISATPNDFSISSASVHLNQINAQNAWNVFNGNSNITVAIVDNAIMWTHADLVANTYTNTAETPGNGVDDDGNGYIDDVNGFDVADNDNNTAPPSTVTPWDHGTFCAGIAGATTDNSIGIASIGWNIKLIPVKGEANTGTATSVTYGYEGIVYAVKAKARIISCSFGIANGGSFTEQSVINYAWSRGCIIVAASGNLSTNTNHYPCAYNNVYCVTGVTASDVKIGFANYGTWVDIAAPGDNIYSTAAYTGTTPAYNSNSGTSFAAPMVAGLAGLMLSKSPNMTRTDVLNCISSTAVNIYTLSGNSTYSNELGAGRIEAYQAMLCAASFSALPPVANFSAFPLNTCPNTPVAFTDSSLYAPTAWSWTFQGGSPATSTLANPVVSWSVAGTYSVSLMVSNASGTNTKTKLAYITVAGPVALPLQEGFQSAQFLPAGWTPKNIGNDHIYWERRTGVGGFATSTACAIFDNYNHITANDRDEMRTPKYDLTNVTSVRMRFDVAYARYSATFADSLEVKLSTNCGINWSTIYVKGGSTLATAPDATSQFTPSSTQWRRDSIDITTQAAGQGNVMFAFINRGHYGQPIYLDNINLFFPAPTLSVVSQQTACTGGPVSFSNSSSGSAGYTWTAPGASPPASTATNPVFTFTAAGTHSVTLNGLNGTTTVSLTRTVNVIQQPTVAVSSASMCSGHNVTLTATGASTFSWSAGGSGAVITLSPSATTVYTVTGTNGGICSSAATATVTVQASPTVSAIPQTVCPGGTATLSASGAASYSWNTGATTSSIIVTPTATMIFTVQGTSGQCSDTRTTTLTLGPPMPLSLTMQPPSICAGSSATLSAGGASSFSWNTGSFAQSIVVTPGATSTYTLFGSTGSCTGSAVGTVTVAPVPTLAISLSPAGPYCSGGTVTLSASGAASYSWSNGSQNATATVSPAGTTVYTLTGSNTGCSSTATVQVLISGPALIPSITVSSTTLCAGSPATLTASGATSYTWSNGAGFTSIIVNPTITSTYTLYGQSGSCSGSAVQTLTVFGTPAAALTITGSACSTGCSGMMNAGITGGTAPYTFSLSGSNCSTLPCNNLCPGLYTLFLTDALGCKNNAFFSISNAAPLTAAISFTEASCTTCNDGKMSVSAASGIPPYSYTWQPTGGNAASATGLAPGCYTVTVADAVGCVVTGSACITGATGLAQNAGSSLRIFPNPVKTKLYVEMAGDYNLTLYNALGQMVASAEKCHDRAALETATFAKGVYVICVRNHEGVITRKIIIE